MPSVQRFYKRTKDVLSPAGSEGKVSDEEILNVFRQADERVLKKSEVAGELAIGAKQVGNRLESLENEGRVHRRKLDPTHIWWIDEDEPSIPVRTSGNTLVWAGGHLRQIGSYLFYGAGMLAITTVLLLAAYLSIVFYPGLSRILTQEQITHGAFLAAITAILYSISGCVFLLVSQLFLWRSRASE